MAKPVKIAYNIEGFYQLRSDPGVVENLEARGRAVLSAAGGRRAGFRMASRQGAKNPQGRHRVSVAAVTKRAKRKNEEENTLIQALDAGSD